MKVIDEDNNVVGELELPDNVLELEDRLLVGYTYIGDGQMAIRETYLNKANGGSVIGMDAIRELAQYDTAGEEEPDGPPVDTKPEVPLSNDAAQAAGAKAPPEGVQDPNNATDNAIDPGTSQVRRAAK